MSDPAIVVGAVPGSMPQGGERTWEQEAQRSEADVVPPASGAATRA
jgi:hypothetical protein